MSTTLLVAISVGTVALVGFAGWALSREAPATLNIGPAERMPVARPQPEPAREVDLDPADRATLPPTVGLFEEEDEDAVTVMASAADMKALLGELEDED